MITRLLLRNFQKHRKLDLRLGRITTFVGESDAGKSSVLRALRWVCSNSPKGNSFIRTGAKYCSATIWVDGHKVKRTKKGGSNTYEMDGEVYHSFSTGVPEAIANVLRVGVENFQQQHDPIFWLSLSPAEVSKRLNEIADLQVMDDSIRKSLAIKKEAQHRLKFCKEQRKAAKKRCGELAYVPEMSNAIRTLQALAENIDEQRSSLARLISLCASVETNTEKAAKLETAVLGAQKLAEAETVIEHKKASLRLLRKALDDAKRYASIPEIDLDDEFKQLQATKDKQKRLYELISTIEDNEREIAQCSKLLRNLQDSANIPMCPTCGRPIQPSQK